MHYYLARWEWVTESGFSFWQPPLADQYVACLDFRSLPQQALFGGIPEGWGFFAYPNPVVIANSIDLGDGLAGNINNAKKNGLRNNLGLTGNVSATKLVDILWELYTTHADATGLLRWKPLMPNNNNVLELVLNGHSVVKSQKLIPGISPEWNQVIAIYQNEYRKIRELGELGFHDRDLHRKFLQTLVEQFHLEPNKFIPADLPIETPLPHQTVIAESFNTADSTTLGPNLSWTELEGDMEVFSNQCRYASALNFGHITSRADFDFSSTDQYTQIVFANAINGVASAQGCHCRKDSSATLTYYHFQISDESSDRRRSWTRINGTFSNIGSTNGSAAVNDVLRGEVNGSTFRFLLNSVQQHTGTNTAINTGSRCGIGMQSTNTANTRPLIDNFEAGELSLKPFFKRRESTLIRM